MSAINRFLTCLLFIFLISLASVASGQMPSLPPPSLPGAPGSTAVDPGSASAPALPPPGLAAPAAGTTTAAGGTAAAAPPPKPEPPLPPVSISARLEQTSVPAEEVARLVITVQYTRAASDPRPPLDFEFPDPPKADGLTLIGNSLTASTELSGATVTVTRDYTYEFRADREGEHNIGAVGVKYFWTGGRNKSSLSTQPLTVTVTKPRIKLSRFTRNPWAIGGLAAAIIVAIAALLWPAVKARRQRRAAAAAPAPSVYDAARERLLAVDRLRMAGEHERFVAAVSAEVDRFIGGVLGGKGRAAERAEKVAEVLGSDWRGRLAAAEHLADQVKFAGHQPTGPEMDEIMATARKLIEETEKARPAERQ